MIATKLKLKMQIKLSYGYVIGSVVRSHFPEATMVPNCFPVISDDAVHIFIMVNNCPDMADKVSAMNQDHRLLKGSVIMDE